MQETNMTQAMDHEEAVVCNNCGSVYRCDLFKMGDDWNDFGVRYCPFCGMNPSWEAEFRKSQS